MSNTTNNISYTETLTQAGLEPNQAIVYDILLKNGPLPAGKIHQKSPLKRGLVYKILDDLVEIGLVTKRDEPGKVAIFEPGHPLKLQEMAKLKEKQAKMAQTALEGQLPSLISDFNLVSGKPNVQFFEGKEGIWEVSKDSLSSSTEIYTYADVEAVVKYIKDINDRYAAARDRLKLKKKIIFIDTPFARSYLADYHKEVTDVRLIHMPPAPFQTVMQIYDDKISYITLSSEQMIGVIIHDQRISSMHRQLFEYTWSVAQPLGGALTDTRPPLPASVPPLDVQK